MVLAPAPPRPPRPARPLPEPDLCPVVPAPGPAVPDPEPRLPGTTAEPDDITTLYTLPQRRRRRSRRRALAAAVLAAATAWAGVVIWPASHAAPRPPGRAYAPNSKAVIQLARARQHRRRQRIAQAGADTIAAGGGERRRPALPLEAGHLAAPARPPRTPRPRPRRPDRHPCTRMGMLDGRGGNRVG